VAWRALPDEVKAEKNKDAQTTRRASIALGKKNNLLGEKHSRRLIRLRSKAASALLYDQTADSPETAAANALQLQQQQMPDTKISLARVRRDAARLERKFHGKAQAKDREAQQSINKWLEKQPPLSDICKELADSNLSLQTLPGLPPGSILVETCSSERGRYAQQLLSSLNTKGTNLKAALATSFALTARTISEASAAPIQEDAAGDEVPASQAMPMPGSGGPVPNAKANAGPNKSKCYEIGYCIHDQEQGGDGHKANTAFARIITAIKLQFPRLSHFRPAHLRASNVFMLLQGVLATSADSPHEEESCTSHLWHVGILYLLPFRPTLRICKLAKPDQPLHGPIEVTATNMYSTLRAATKMLDFARTWHLQFFHLRESNLPLPYFNPNNVVMVPYEGAASHQIWPRPGRGGGKRAKKPSGPGRGPIPDKGDDDLAIEDDGDCGDGHGPEEQLDSEDAEDPEEVARLREFNALLEKARSSLEKRARAERDQKQNDPDKDEKEQDSVNTSDISLTPLPSGVVSSASSISCPESLAVKSHASTMARSAVGAADLVLRVPGGTIRYYSNKCNFTATCSRHSDENCVKTRQSTASKIGLKSVSGQAKGRPLGYLVAWLAMNQHDGCDSKAKHWDKKENARKCTHAMRLAARLSLHTMDGGEAMMDRERDLRPGEGDEPLGLA
jgi:hypothetical protein